MPRVDFYILNAADEEQRQIYLCRIADKAFGLGHRIWIHTAQGGADALDARLWTFSQGSFLPHERADSPDAADCAVVLGDGAPPDSDRALLINDDTAVPAFAAQFERIVEIIDQSEATRRRGRERYAHYRDQGFELRTHQLG
jgi:DNA polymerase-3 subunit chi